MTDEVRDQDQPSATQYGKIIATLVVVLAIAVSIIVWLWLQQNETESTPVVVPEPQQTTIVETPVVSEPEPVVEPEREPVATVELEPDVETEEPASIEVPLPALAQSSADIKRDLEQAEQAIGPLQSDQLIRDAVVFIDNLRNGLVIRDKALVAAPRNRFRVIEQNGQLYIDPRSYDRYNTMVDWFVSLDNKVIADLFKKYQPLIAEALAEIGYPDADPLVVLDEAFAAVMATPAVGTVIELTDDSVMYKYADETLEALPAVQKQMLRMGPDNIRRVKLKIEALRAELMN